VSAGATDIHIEPGDRELRVRFRIDGRLMIKLRPPLAMAPALVGYVKALMGMDLQNRAAPQEGAVGLVVKGKTVELRGSTMAGCFGEIAVMHISDGSALPSNLEKLGFGYETLKQWRKLIRLHSGLILASAPAGSGKRATLYATAGELNSVELNICTIEESIKHKMPGINQFSLDHKIGPGVPGALRAILNQQPDVIAICDLPDSESVRLAAQAALSGHLVIAALRANDAAAGIARMSHLGIEPHLVGATLAGVLSQRLVRKLCPRCKEPVTPTASQRRQIEKIGAETDVVYKPRGCEHCRNLGFFGRIGIYELIVPDDTMLETINRGASLSQIRELARAAGMRTIRDDGIEKVNAGITTLEEVHRVTA
jgi:type II secretory ATPase GspE/PulE/Tfp pilus assembly ATPase PilB-like protein